MPINQPKSERRTSTLTIALTKTEKATIEKAAKLLGYPHSIWARSLTLKEAAKVIGEAKAAK